GYEAATDLDPAEDLERDSSSESFGNTKSLKQTSAAILVTSPVNFYQVSGTFTSDDRSDLRIRSGKFTLSPSRKYPWTLTHGFYTIMGGYAFDASGESPFLPGRYTQAVLTVHGVTWLMENDPSLIPDLSADMIMDKSKADALAKALLLIQALWFCMNCLSRLAQRLPLSLLEVTTVAHALCTFITYLLWWNKPLNIHQPTLISETKARETCAVMWMASPIKLYHFSGILQSRGPTELDMIAQLDPSTLPAHDIINPETNLTRPLPLPIGKSLGRTGFSPDPNRTFLSLSSLPHQFRSNFLGMMMIQSPESMVLSELNSDSAWYSQPPINSRDGILLGAQDIKRWTLASEAISHYGPKYKWDKSTPLVALQVEYHEIVRFVADIPTCAGIAFLTAAYGAPHLAAWNADFATYLEQLLWRASVLVITFAGLLMHALTWMGLEIAIRSSNRLVKTSGSILAICVPICGILLYAAASVYLVVESFTQLFHLPPAAYQLPSWSNYFPHFS
ncbi:hypothetical protein PHLCEN_2v8000, partial [Hermanssonia centrifuga]